MSHTGNDTNTAILDTNDITVVIGKPSGSSSGYLYIEVNRPIASTGAFVLERNVFEDNVMYTKVYEQAKPIIESLLKGEVTLGISQVRVGLNFVSPVIMEHYVHLLDAYMAIALKVIQAAFGDLPLDVYVIEQRFTESDLAALQRAVPAATVVSNSDALQEKLFAKTHPAI